MEMMDPATWPDHQWMSDGEEATESLRLPYVLTEIFQTKEMQDHDRQQYRVLIYAFQHLLPNLISDEIVNLEKVAHHFMFSSFSAPHSLEEAPDIYTPIVHACDVVALCTQIRRRLSCLNHLTAIDMERYLKIALTDPRSPELHIYGLAMHNRYLAFQRFSKRLCKYILELHGLENVELESWRSLKQTHTKDLLMHDFGLLLLDIICKVNVELKLLVMAKTIAWLPGNCNLEASLWAGIY